MLSEIRTFLEPWYMKWGVMTLSAAIGVGAYNWICWSGLSASDWGVWVGAVGTVATLIGTIHLARTETRRRRKTEVELALVAAADFSIRIPDMQRSLYVAKKYLDENRHNNGDFKYSESSTILQQATYWSSADLTPLLHIDGRLGVRLGLAQAEVISTIRALGRAVSMSWEPEVEQQFIDMMIRRIDEGLRHLKDTRNECLAFMLKHGISDAFVI